MKFLNHIEEIKNRVLLVFINLTSLLLITFYYQKTLLYLIVKPSLYLFQENSFYFIFTDLTEIFLAYLKLNFFVSLNVATMFLLVQLFFFLTPIWYTTEYKTIRSKINHIIGFWVVSFGATYYVLVPFSWFFFLNFQSTGKTEHLDFFAVYFEARISEYINFFVEIQMICASSLFILLFLFFFLIQADNLINNIQKSRKYIFLFLFFVASIISTPEILMQLFVGTLVCALFEILLLKFLLSENYEKS